MNYVRLAVSYPGYIGFGAIHYFFSGFGQTFIISVFVPFFIQSLSISNSDFSLIYALATVISGFLLPFGGSLVDSIKIRYASIIVGVGIAIFCLVLSFAINIYLLFIGLLGIRFFGQGMMTLIGSAAVGRFFDLDRGKALSIASLGLPVSEAMMPLLLIWLNSNIGWQLSWQLSAVMVLAVFLPSVFLMVEKNSPFQQVALPNETMKNGTFTVWEILLNKRFLMLIPSLVFVPLFLTGIFIHQNIVAEIKNWSLQLMAAGFVGYGFSRIITNFLAGSIIDKFTAKMIYLFHLLPMILAMLLLMVGTHVYSLQTYMVLLGISVSLKGIAGTALWAEIYGIQRLGTIKSLSAMIIVFATAIGPVAMGYTLEIGLNFTLVCGIAFALVATLMAWYTIKHQE
jgi:MFS family permease